MQPAYLSNRESDVINCPGCELVQFKTAFGFCRRCHQALGSPQSHLQRISIKPSANSVSDVPLANRIGDAIRILRKERRISQEQLAISVGTARSYLSRIERGVSVPTLKSLQRIASALGIELTELLIHPC
jgi:ribosome-binding protein aMBF1 (putative translation factor)